MLPNHIVGLTIVLVFLAGLFLGFFIVEQYFLKVKRDVQFLFSPNKYYFRCVLMFIAIELIISIGCMCIFLWLSSPS